MTQWYQKSVGELTQFFGHSAALDIKYGNIDKTTDIRWVDREFPYVFRKVVGSCDDTDTLGNNALIVGSNDGDEIKLLQDMGLKFVAVDMSIRALSRLAYRQPEAIPILGDANTLPFKNDVFGKVIAMRILGAWGLDIPTAISELYRVTTSPGCIVVSIPNGYLVNGKVIFGMYDVETKTFDRGYPFALRAQVQDLFLSYGMEVLMKNTMSEFLIRATKL